MSNPLIFQKLSPKEIALKAAREKASASQNAAAITKWISPAEAKERLRLVFDDSGSMSGKPIEDAREGTIEYMRNCPPNQTAVAIHFLNTDSPLKDLSSNLIEIASRLRDTKFKMGGTPLFKITMEALEATPRLTRMVMFTDGSPTDQLTEYSATPVHPHNRSLDSADIVIAKAKELGNIPIDTIFFGENESYTQTERELLQYIAEGTGGYFMIFDPAKVNFRTAFKYLAPTQRLALASESFRKELQDGKRI